MSAAATGPLVRASFLLLRQPTVLVPAAASLLLPGLMIGVLDTPAVLTILRWTGVLLACVLIAAVDDPSGEVLAASPYPRAVRVAARVGPAVAFAVAVWALAAGLVEWRQPAFPVLPVAVEALGVATVGVALAAGLRAWRDLHRPSQVAAMLLLAVFATAEAMPRWYDLMVVQTWGPPWQAAHLRWAAVTLLGLSVLVAALRDPLGRPVRTRKTASRV